MSTTLRIFTLGKHQVHKKIKFATKGSWQTEMNISHSNQNVIFFLLISNQEQLTNRKNLNFQILSNEINKHSTRNWYKMNWFSKRERERERN